MPQFILFDVSRISDRELNLFDLIYNIYFVLIRLCMQILWQVFANLMTYSP